MREFLHGDFLATKREPFANRTGGGKQREFPDGKIPLFQTKPHFFTDGTRRTYNCHMRRIHIESRPSPCRDGQFNRFPPAGNKIVGFIVVAKIRRALPCQYPLSI
jgi:hypothetical protein